ncbi:enoyl-CoA hydratase/carnithine racemase [Corynebacterium mustelae]|uniref:Enoyl-CoA hydratase/carnithine racemase n=1 Tax=Corynebacterium mustelae TaxID=571915 RepID=A0A0G3H2H0_9CORY|nr:enoyl-CoA hydratase/carnithine racemase [Corynebacterium mustelae]
MEGSVIVTEPGNNEELLVETTGRVRVITLNRPEKRNALNADICRKIAVVVHEAAHGSSDTSRAILIRGNGKAFCAGADLGPTDAQAEATGGVYGGGFHEALHTMLRAIVNSPIPVIADIQGPAVGAGTQLSLACDLRVAGVSAWFGVPAAALGFALDSWTINRAKDLLGGSVARNMLIAHQRVTADQAAVVGFVTKIGDSQTALSFAEEVASLAPLAMKQLKGVLNERDGSYNLDAQQQELYDACWASEDAAEAKVARREKRAPIFRGR